MRRLAILILIVFDTLFLKIVFKDSKRKRHTFKLKTVKIVLQTYLTVASVLALIQHEMIGWHTRLATLPRP